MIAPFVVGRRARCQIGTQLDTGYQEIVKTRFVVRSMILGGLTAGTIDIGATCLISWGSPLLIRRNVEEASFHEGLTSVAVGQLLQWLMSILIAGCAAIAGLWRPILRKRWYAAGAVYGVVIFSLLNYVVLPLSAVRHSPHISVRTLIGNLLAMLLFGLIVTFAVRDTPPRTSNGSNG
jgi:hypothetical protein